MKNSDFIKTLEKGFGILEAFTPECPNLKFMEISKKTGLPKSTVSRFLNTLITLGYVSHEPFEKYYFLSPKVMSLGFTTLSSLNITKLSIPYLEELSRKTDQNVNLAILDNTEVIYIQRIERRQIVSTNFSVGSRLSAYNTAIGRAILAYLEPEKLQDVVEKILKNPDVQIKFGKRGERLFGILNDVKKNGFSLSDGEMKGVRAVAAPIFNDKVKIVAAVNVPVFSYAVSKKKLIDEYLSLLIDAAYKISKSLGCNICEKFYQPLGKSKSTKG